ncbi:acetoin utilization AcuB family protein [Bacillus sinesaloumensis]|uniref:acetoin utilization AcuB family protein n=1 Tax=Litchfieldia sinesaloumensis TaxID=1926280 RepID=UPI0009884A5F|nr:acetoin utilization AcuB family protein [Bacillus sinesaloumensis]
MIVEEIMKKIVTTLSPKDTISTAIKIMDDKKIRHIPIVDAHQHVIGLISDRDIRDAKPSILDFTNQDKNLDTPVKEIMVKDVITGHPLDFVEEISAVFSQHRIGCLPIETNGKLVGIITETDLLHTFAQLTGANQPGSQLEIKVPNRAGTLAEVINVIKDHNVNIHSVLVYPDKDIQFKILALRIQTMNPTKIVENLKNEGYNVLWPNISGF